MKHLTLNLVPEMVKYYIPNHRDIENPQQIIEIEKVKEIFIIFMTALMANESKTLALQSDGFDNKARSNQIEELLTFIKTFLKFGSLKPKSEKKQMELKDAQKNIQKPQDSNPLCPLCKGAEGHEKISQHLDYEAELSKKYPKINLSDNMRREYAEKLEKYMCTEEPFLDEDIRVEQIADELNIPQHHLSMTINIEFNKNFYNYINHYRIQYAQNLLKDTDEKGETILMIAYRSGFKSKTSFNKTFKLLVGMTPSDYRKRHLSQTVQKRYSLNTFSAAI